MTAAHNPCWRGECRTACYYPETCRETATAPDGGGLTEAERERRERRKYGTDSPNEPTDEFVIQAFAEGAQSLWPDSRDPGWHVTFQRILAARSTAPDTEANTLVEGHHPRLLTAAADRTAAIREGSDT